MSKPRIVLKKWDDGDWSELYLDGHELASSHSLSDHDWITLLASIGHDVVVRHVDDPDGNQCHEGV